jgi:hypothetical protein
MTTEVLPPRIASITVSPDAVVSGDSATGRVTLDRPSLRGDVVVNLLSSAPGFATVPAQVTIRQNSLSATFSISTPEIAVPFQTAHATIYATYAGSSVAAVLTVKAKIIAGILSSLRIFPQTVTGGNPGRGTVTLIQAVPTDTVIGLAALEWGTGPIPLPGNASSVASVPASVTIRAGQTSATFTITTSHVPSQTTRRATIMAGAVVEKYAALTITG